MTRMLLEQSLRFIEGVVVYNARQTMDKHILIAELQHELARPAIPDGLSERVDAWFAKNTGLVWCSDKDIAELTEIFYAVAMEQLEKARRRNDP